MMPVWSCVCWWFNCPPHWCLFQVVARITPATSQASDPGLLLQQQADSSVWTAYLPHVITPVTYTTRLWDVYTSWTKCSQQSGFCAIQGDCAERPPGKRNDILHRDCHFFQIWHHSTQRRIPLQCPCKYKYGDGEAQGRFNKRLHM